MTGSAFLYYLTDDKAVDHFKCPEMFATRNCSIAVLFSSD